MERRKFELVPDASDRVMPTLVAACPSFATHEPADPSDTGGDRLPYVLMWEFALHLVDRLQQDETTEFPEVFRVVEELLTANESGVRDLIIVGLIGDLQSAAASRQSGLAGGFRRWLGPATAVSWDEVHRFWGTSDSAGEIRAR